MYPSMILWIWFARFVAKYYSYYRIYDAKGKVLKAMNASDVGEIVGVSGKTITSRKGSWIYTWNKEGKKIRATPAQSGFSQSKMD